MFQIRLADGSLTDFAYDGDRTEVTFGDSQGSIRELRSRDPVLVHGERLDDGTLRASRVTHLKADRPSTSGDS